MGSINKVVAVLVVWAVMVTAWMMVLSTSGSWSRCTNSRQRVADTQTLHSSSSDPLGAHAEQTRLVLPIEAATNSDPAQKRRSYYFSKIMHRPDSEGGSRSNEENCTVVILTHKRTRTLSKIISHYCKIQFLQRILVVWNNVNETIPFIMKSWETRCALSEVKFIQPWSNKLINRYLPWREIETDCVCFLDDDHVISIYDMQFGYEVWQNFRHQLVGFQESGFINNANGSYVYKPHQRQRYIGIKYKTGPPLRSNVELKNGTRILHIGNKTYVLGKPPEYLSRKVSDYSSPNEVDGYSIMGAPSFVHKAYLEMYFDPAFVPAGAVEYVENLNNCEDILLSIVVTKFLQDMNFTRHGVLAMKNSLTIKGLEEETSTEGPQLSKRPDYYSERSECLNRFSQLYGHLPLQLSSSIATLV